MHGNLCVCADFVWAEVSQATFLLSQWKSGLSVVSG